MTTSVRAEAISKRYRLGQRRRHDTLRDAVASVLERPPGFRRAEPEAFTWALRDVSFEIQSGEAVGFIGRNGAGKSTLLKILSRITRPTSGSGEIAGRVGALLEVGTGFHGELTGRENIYLNGAILGLTRRQIDRRFDAVVEFADVSEFLDTPVKRYSSGMTARLAFSVAAHLEPDVLLVDEVLAVGDLAFQRKCLEKMRTVASEGRTVLFVSHNMSVIQALCRRGIFLDRGRVAADGRVEDAVAAYLRTLELAVAEDLEHRPDRRGWQELRLQKIAIEGSDGGRATALATGRQAMFTFRLTSLLPRTSCTFTIYDQLGAPVTTLSSRQAGLEDATSPDREPMLVCTIDELPLRPGRYRVDVEIHGRGHLQDAVEGAAFFDVEDGAVRGRPAQEHGYGAVVLPHRWLLPQDALSP